MSDIHVTHPEAVRPTFRPPSVYRPSRSRPGAAETVDCEADCCCTKCSMSTMVRPRYFAGQLLSDRDLRDEQSYQIAKQRLHNRFLHGDGVVCGLQVSCDRCDERSVTIHPGYAIGPCGEDILVPCATTIDVIGAIDACKRSPVDCDPIRTRPDDIADVEEHWCITLAYCEDLVAEKAVLREPRGRGCSCSTGRGCGDPRDCSCRDQHDGCGCTSNGSSHKGECSCGGGCACGDIPSRVYVPGKRLNCEPTRVREGYTVGVVDRACAPCDDRLRDSELARSGRELFGAFATMTRTVGSADLMALLVYAFAPWDKLPAQYQNARAATSTLTAAKAGVWGLYHDNPLGIPCPDLHTVEQVAIPVEEPAHGGVTIDYQHQVKASSLNTATLVLRYFWQYICTKLNPPCPPDPCDDRLVLACVTVRGDRVVDVCNFACRDTAGSFTSWDYWLSLVGIKPLLRTVLEALCCADLISAKSPIRNRLGEILDRVDPDSSIRAGLVADDYARVKTVATDLASIGRLLDVSSVMEVVRKVVAPGEGEDFVGAIGKPARSVAADLSAAGVTVTVVDVEGDRPGSTLRAAATSGARDVRLLRDSRTGTVVGVEPALRAGIDPAMEARVEDLSKEVLVLRAELARMRDDQDRSTYPRATEESGPREGEDE